MKYYSFLLPLAFSVFFYANGHAQDSVKDKVVGCWKLDKIELVDPTAKPEFPPEMYNTVLCLQKDGKFVTTVGDDSNGGIYMISEDGKTITQRMTGGTDDTGDITLINDTALEIKTAEVVIKLIRVKE
jgi:hypothetical protein